MAEPLHVALIVLVTSKVILSLPFFIALCSACRRPMRSTPATYGNSLWDFKTAAQLQAAPVAALLLVLAVGDVLLAIFIPGEVRIACAAAVLCSGIILVACANVVRTSLGARVAFQEAVKVLPRPNCQGESLAEREGKAFQAFPMSAGHMNPRRLFECVLPIRLNQSKTISKDITYASAENKFHRLDWIRSRGVCAGAPTLLYIHGGGWTSGDKSAASLPTLYDFAEHMPWNVLSVNYTITSHEDSTPLWPTNLHDCFRAVAWARENVATNGAPLVVMGDSAGGHLASLVGLTHTVLSMLPADVQGKDVVINGVIDLYGFCHDARDVNGHYEHFGVDDMQKVVTSILMKPVNAGKSHELDDLNPISWVRQVESKSIPEPPPFFVAHGDNDDCVPAADVASFFEALVHMRRVCGSTRKVPDIHVQAPGLGHAFNYSYSPSSFALSDSLGLFCSAIASSNAV